MTLIKKNRSFDRRTLLRGAFGATVALPLLEIMLDGKRARAATTPPNRFFIAFGGVSLGADGDRAHDDYVPTTVGPGYDPSKKTATQPLVKDDLGKEVTIVSGLRVPYDGSPGSYYGAKFHGSNHSPLLSGVMSSGTDGPKAIIKGVTSDQIAAETLGPGTRFPSGLQLCVQAKAYSPGPAFGWVISMRRNASGGLERLEPTISPRAAWKMLFYGLQQPQDSAAQAAFERERRLRLSVLDACQASRAELGKNLGAADRRILDRFYDHCREIEQRLATLDADPAAACKPPADPGADPPEAADTGSSMTGGKVPEGTGWSNETLRGRIHCDLVAMAFACDLTRVASLTITRNQCFMSSKPVTGYSTDMHGLGHFASGAPHTTAVVAKGTAWHMEHFAYLVKLLRDTKEADGKPILDRSALAFVTEGGHGNSPEDSNFSAAGSSHSMENMVIAVAGGAGGLKRGHHVRATGKHPGNVLVTLLNAVGSKATKLGDVSGAIPDLVVGR